MKAVRLEDVLDGEPSDISTNFSHIDHMYTGRLADYYYARFDQALEAAQLLPSDRVLEIGGGTGVFTLTLSTVSEEVYFSDISREVPLFSTPRKLFADSSLDGSNVRYVAADATGLPFDDNSFDVVFALDVLEHIPGEAAAIEELSRVTAPDGRAVVSAPIEVGPPLLYREFYRYVDGRRSKSESFSEVLRGILGSPPHVDAHGHRGYDYRQTVRGLSAGFETTNTDFCPLPAFGWLNPTAIVRAMSPVQE